MELHPLCTLFPRLSGAEFDALRDDIKANGLRAPIVLHDRMILDGGNRYRACVEAGVEPVFTEFTGGNLVSFVLSANLHRRHMSAGQQAAIVASAQDWAQAQQHGGARRGDQVATLPLETIKSRAAESGASERTQRMADKVAKADPELARKVAHGDVSLPKAHASLSPKQAPVVSVQAEDVEADETDPFVLLEEAQKEIERLTALIAAAEADDLKAEAIKWRKAYEHAQRVADDKQSIAHRYQTELQKASDRLTRIGKLFNERDASKIPALVERMFRSAEKAAA